MAKRAYNLLVGGHTHAVLEIMPDFCWLTVRDIRNMLWILHPEWDYYGISVAIVNLIRMKKVEKKPFEGSVSGGTFTERTYRPRFLYKKVCQP